MLDDTNRYDATNAGQQFAQGTPVYDVNGDKIGTVADVDQQNNGLVIQKGLFFPKDIPVPMSAIARSDAEGIYLNTTKDDVVNGNFASAGGGTYATDRAVDTETPYRADAARAAGDRDLNLGDRAAATTDRVANRDTNYSGDDLTAGTGQQTPVRDGDLAVPVREEELVAGRQREETGRVHVHKDVTEQQQTMNVPVTHEEVRVERVPVDKDVPADQLGAEAWQEKDVDVPLMGEQVETGKRAHVAEELHLHKTPVTEQQQVSDTVRKEQVRLDGADVQGDPNLAGGSDYDTTIRRDTSADDNAPTRNP
jgi:uncharacterized protein (TIGR02271 family)